MTRIIFAGGCHGTDESIDNFYLQIERKYYSCKFEKYYIHLVENDNYLIDKNLKCVLKSLQESAKELNEKTILIIQLGNSLFANKTKFYIPKFLNPIHRELINKKENDQPYSTLFLSEYPSGELQRGKEILSFEPRIKFNLFKNGMKFIALPFNFVFITMVFPYYVILLRKVLYKYGSRNNLIIITSPFKCLPLYSKILRRYGNFLFNLFFRNRFLKNVRLIDCYNLFSESDNFKDRIHLDQNGHNKLFNSIVSIIEHFI